MNKNDIKDMIKKYRYYVDKIVFPNGDNGGPCSYVEEMNKICSTLAMSAGLISSFRTDLIMKNFRKEIKFLSIGTCAFGVYLYDKQHDDEDKIEDLIEKGYSILVLPALKNAHKLLDISHSGNRITIFPENKGKAKQEISEFFLNNYTDFVQYTCAQMMEISE